MVGGLEHDWIMTFHSFGNVIIPTHFNSIMFQRGWFKPPSRNIYILTKATRPKFPLVAQFLGVFGCHRLSGHFGTARGYRLTGCLVLWLLQVCRTLDLVEFSDLVGLWQRFTLVFALTSPSSPIFLVSAGVPNICLQVLSFGLGLRWLIFSAYFLPYLDHCQFQLWYSIWFCEELYLEEVPATIYWHYSLMCSVLLIFLIFVIEIELVGDTLR